ncbi:MAG: penicillin acylase family protein [Duganella sp.]
MRGWTGKQWRRLAAAWAALAFCAAQAAPARVEIRRTTDGVPHVLAADWQGLGYGYGYVQAQDALCTMAEAFLTYEGRRSAHFGADARLVANSTLGHPKNSELDFFFRAHANAAMVQAMRAEQPAQLQAMISGFAQGYNRYLEQARTAGEQPGAPACLAQPWLRPISADDIYRRMYAAAIAGGYARFIGEIANAAPKPAAGLPAAAKADHDASLAALLAPRVGQQIGLGSNAIAFGGRATGGDGAVLFGNPHWYWGGPDRFYQAQLTIPGKINVAGVSFLGIPVIMLGFNEHVAWTHTVSDARRFGVFELSLTPDRPDSYRYDGRDMAMEQTSVSIEVLGADGKLHEQRRTLYGSRFGPLLDLGQRNPAFGWSATTALAIRDVNAANYRIFRNYFYWASARSLDDFIAIQRREGAMPWVNTLAIGRHDPRAWYGDIGNVPHVPDQLRAACTTALGQGFAQMDGAVPFLDGSRAQCNWRHDESAAQAGAMPVAEMPGLLRDDYVANMNDSYWLSNPQQPLQGFARTLGGEQLALSPRGRYGHLLAQQLAGAQSRSGMALAWRTMDAVLDPLSHAAVLYKNDLLDGACAGMSDGHDLAAACTLLRQWDNRASTDARGALLWAQWWRQLDRLPASQLYRTDFDAALPLHTPAAINGADPRVRAALAAAVQSVRAGGHALDAPLGSVQALRTDGTAVYGGCSAAGYFTVACSHAKDGRLDAQSEGNSYLQVVRFGSEGVAAHTLLAHGEREQALAGGAGASAGAVTGTGKAALHRYARKQWLPFAFSEQAIAADPALTRQVLLP